MVEKEVGSLLPRLRAREKILCEKCRNGHYMPYNTTADKAHSFICSNPKCNNHINIDPIIDIE